MPQTHQWIIRDYSMPFVVVECINVIVFTKRCFRQVGGAVRNLRWLGERSPTRYLLSLFVLWGIMKLVTARRVCFAMGLKKSRIC